MCQLQAAEEAVLLPQLVQLHLLILLLGNFGSKTIPVSYTFITMMAIAFSGFSQLAVQDLLGRLARLEVLAALQGLQV
jgi:hypothetical protein